MSRYKKLGIPRSFSIHAHKIKVSIVPKSRWRHGMNAIGIWEPHKLKISLRGDQPDTVISATFVHELVHASLDSLNDKLSYNEKWVDNYAQVLHQILVSFSDKS